ncbi:uncharacterized protein LOC141905138 [Tubulanus polymorphus]|uniref:uncharacterized protein LOC141905138 n=1 Tax=Tubulanus polymorphus TaxID=672921 RepID=UPI003DA35C35
MKIAISRFAVFMVIVLQNAMQTKQCEWEDKLNDLKKTLGHLSRQVMLLQMYNEDRVRNDGNSGIVNIRLQHIGSKTYQATSYTQNRMLSIHTHSNHRYTVGMGELSAVLNGVLFKTRHNDYKMKMPASVVNNNTIDYKETVEIPFPPVPPSVTGTVEEQSAELREFFKAFQDQNVTHRDYRPFFRPVLCYLEGAWTISDQGSIDEPFDSDRHHIDAASWLELQDKIKFSSATGRKHRLENLSNLPTMILTVQDNKPVYAQWNYRILCHPLKDDLPTDRLKLVDDYHVRMAFNRNLEDYANSRAARFNVVAKDQPKENQRDSIYRYGLLDELMAEIPGPNGYGTQLLDGGITGTDYAMQYNDREKKLNAGYYHRVFRTGSKDAMGDTVQRRGFHDETVFFAKTTQPKYAPATLKHCRGRGRSERCELATQRWAYAIPLEIIYTTPLQNWNPYEIAYSETKPYVKDNSTGSEEFPFSHWSDRGFFYRTPLDFYSNAKQSGDPADTSNGARFMLDKKGVGRRCVASGTHIFLPPIPSAASDGTIIKNEPIRTRYPIAPVALAGNVVWKRTDAIADLLLEPADQHSKVEVALKAEASAACGQK